MNAVALEKNIGKQLEKARQSVETALLIYEAARQKFNEHIASHECAGRFHGAIGR